MQSIQFHFDVTNVDVFVAGGEPLPNGTYPMDITNMELKANNDASSGHNLAIEWTVFEGEFKGRKHFENLNLWHTKSSAAVDIANKQLSSIGHAVGVLTGEDLTILANRHALVTVSLETSADRVNPNTGETIKGRQQNRTIRHDPYSAAGSGAPINMQQQQQAAAAAQAPAFNPAAQQAAPAQAPIQQAAPMQAAAPAAQQQAPAFTAQQQPPAAVNGAAPPPWQR